MSRKFVGPCAHGKGDRDIGVLVAFSRAGSLPQIRFEGIQPTRPASRTPLSRFVAS